MARKKRGTVYKFRDKYRAMYSAPDGSKPSEVFDDPSEADKWLTARLAEIDQGLYTVPSDMTFRIWGEKWLEISLSLTLLTSTRTHANLERNPVKWWFFAVFREGI